MTISRTSLVARSLYQMITSGRYVTTDSLLQRIVSTEQLRLEVSWRDGFFRNGKMAKLVISCGIRSYPSGMEPCLMISTMSVSSVFPRNMSLQQEAIISDMALEFGAKYTRKQAYLRGMILTRARVMSENQSAGPRPQQGFQESTPALESPITKEQIDVLSAIGNKKLTWRLYKRTLKIFSREKRLNAVKFYQTRKHVDPRSGQERPISINSASEALHIPPGTLRRW